MWLWQCVKDWATYNMVCMVNMSLVNSSKFDVYGQHFGVNCKGGYVDQCI
jgi:hypothetical protein